MQKRSGILSALVATVVCLPFVVSLPQARNDIQPTNPYDVLQSCTIFGATYGNTVLFGNNEDTTRRPGGAYWVTPASPGNYAVLYIGFKEYKSMCMGGVNEKGLACDANRLSNEPVNVHPEKPSFDGWIMSEILPKCATVQDVIDMVKNHNWENPAWYQVNFADANGDMVVVSVGPDGEMAFNRSWPGDCFLVSTNFNLAGAPAPCERYAKASEILAEIKTERKLNVNLFRSVLDAVHQEGLPYYNNTLRGQVNTTYSNIFDLKNMVGYIYYYHQFDYVAKVDIKKEITKGAHTVNFADLFPQKILEQSEVEYKKYEDDPYAYYDRISNPQGTQNKNIDLKQIVLYPVIGLLTLVGTGLLVYRKYHRKKKRTMTAEQTKMENQ